MALSGMWPFLEMAGRWPPVPTTARLSYGTWRQCRRRRRCTGMTDPFRASPFLPTATIWRARAAGPCACGTRLPSKKLPRQARQRGRGDECAEWCGNHEGRARLSQRAVRGRCAGTDARYDTKSIGVTSIYAGLGDADRAFEHLTAALNKKSAWLPSIVVEPKFNHLRNDRRYGEILARMKLPFKPDGRIKPQAELP